MARKRSVGKYPWIHDSLQALAVPIDSLRPDPDNALTHPEENVEAIAASLEEFGQDQPLVVQKDGMVVRKGNGRLQAARRLGWTHIAALIVDDDDLRAAARAVADNRSSQLAKWDDAVLARLLEKFRTAPPEAGAPIVGFTEEQVSRVLSRFSPRSEVSPSAEPATVPVSQPVGGADGSAGAAGAAGTAGGPSQGPGPISSHVRMCQLFLDTETYPDFQDCIERLQAFYGTENATTTVVEALRRERERITS